MENAELYSGYNSLQRQDTEGVLQEFLPQLVWSYEEEKVLDVGCGPGDVTAEAILPHLPPSASMIGVDISKKMVEYANNKYSNERLTFEFLDFSSKNVTQVFPEKSFSKLLSFYCLHWIRDQQQAAKNMYSLLRPGGEFLVLMSNNSNVFMIYKILSEMEKWKNYMKDLDDYMPCFYGVKDLCTEIRKVWSSNGLEIITCEDRQKTVSFPSMKVLIRSNEAINPFVKRMNQHTREQYMAAYEQIIEDNHLSTETVTGEVLVENQFVVIHGRRPYTEHF